jgi:hypothetical protein
MISGEQTKYSTRVGPARLIKVTPPLGLSHGAFKLMGTWCNNLGLLFYCPFSNIVDQACTIRITILHYNKEPTWLDFCPQSLYIYWHFFTSYFIQYIARIN